MAQPADPSYDPRRSVVFSTIAKALPLILGVTAVFGAAGILLSRYQAEQYTAEGRVVLSATRNFDPLGGNSSGAVGRYLANQLEVMRSRPVLELAAGALTDGTGAAALAESIELTAPADTDVIVISATAPDGQQAADRVNAVASAYGTYSGEQVTRVAQAASEAAASDPNRVVEINIAAVAYGNGVQATETAIAPTEPSAPQPLRNGFLLAALGALVTTGLVIWRRGQPLADRGALVEGVGAPVLGLVPVPLPRLRRGAQQQLPDAQDFAMVLVAMGYVVDETSGVIMTTGVRPDSGTPTVALGLAAAAAEQQRRVVVVDASGRGDALQRYTDRVGPVLPIGALADEATPEQRAVVELVHLRPARGGGSVHLASVIAGGAGGSADAIRRGLQRLVDSFDMVVLHAGPVADDPMAFALLRETSVLVAVVDERARTMDLLSLRDKLELAGASCDGLVLTRPGKARRRRSTPAPVPPRSGGATRVEADDADEEPSGDDRHLLEPISSGGARRD